MSHFSKLSLAVGLAIFAAVLNAMWLSSKQQPPLFVAALEDMPADFEITDEMLTAVPVPGDIDTLRASLIPYGNRAILLGQTTTRDYVAGDVFFQRDVQAPRNEAKFEVLGPFKLISVGERFKQTEKSDDEAQLGGSGNNVTIAVSANFDERTRRLLEIIDSSRTVDEGKASAKIVAVQILPADQQSPAIANEENVVYQTVSLEGIENVPRVLLEGEVIRFVVPTTDTL
jgi:hypothetical protein